MASKSIVKEMRIRRLALDTERDLGIEKAPATVGTTGTASVAERAEELEMGGARPAVEVADLRTCSSFQMRRPSMPPSTEMHSPEMCPAAR